MQLNTIRTLRVIGKSEGLKELAADTRNVGKAMNDVAAASSQAATVTDTASKRVGSSATSWNTLQRSVDAVYAAEQRYARDKRTADLALASGITTTERYNNVLELSREKHLGVASAARAAAAAEREAALARTRQETNRAGGWNRLSAAGHDNLSAISSANALTAANARAEGSLRNLGRGGAQAATGLSDAAKSSKAAAHEMTNIGFQISDLAVMMSGGMGAGRSLSTQLPQMLAGKQSLADIKGLGAGIGQFLLNPITLAIAGVSGLGFAFDYFMNNASAGVSKVDDAFEKHAQTIAQIRDLYGDAAKALQEMSKPTALRVTAAGEADKTRLQALLQSQGREATGSLFSKATDMTGEDLYAVNPAYSRAQKAVEAFQKSIQDGRADFRSLLDTVDKLYIESHGDSAIEQLYKNVHKLGDEGEQTQRRLEPVLKTVEDLKKGFGVQSYINGLNDNRDAYLEYKFERDQRSKTATQSYGFDMRETSARTTADRAKLAADRARTSAEQSSDDPDLAATRASNLIYAQANRQNADSDRSWKAAMDQRIASQRLGLAAIGSTATATDAARIKLEEYAEVEREALARGPAWATQRKAEIDKYADSLAALGETTRRAGLVDDLNFENQQLGRSGSEQGIHSRFRSAGLLDKNGEISGAQNEAIADQMRWTETVRETQQAFRGLGSEILEAAKKGDLAGVGKSVLDRTQKLVEGRLSSMIDDGIQTGIGGMLKGTPLEGLGGGVRDGATENPLNIKVAA